MGIISRKVLPACGCMCVCCPSLRSSSRKPVKRYKKLLAEIFPKSPDSPSSERKILKLCEYATRNPARIPKIAKYLEERCLKELRSQHIKSINIVIEAYSKLLCLCKEQMAYFVISLLNVINELLTNSKQDTLQILGCQIFTRFIYAQVDGTYTHNIENLVPKVCMFALEGGENHQRFCLRAASLQCLSAMIWFMAEFSHIFVDFGEIVRVTLENYRVDAHFEDNERGEAHHNWVNEVVRSEGRVGVLSGSDISSDYTITRLQPEKKDPSCLTREEIETPKVWAQICIQRMGELAKESTSMHQVLDPMFVYFDSGRHWVAQQGLALCVLSDMSCFIESSGKQQLILTCVIRHLDHKNVSRDPQLKSYIIQVATVLARQVRSGAKLAEVGFVSNLCRHLRKSLQTTINPVGEEDSNLNIVLQNSIEDCLLEIAKCIGNVQPLLDMMALTLEKLPSGTFARATIGSSMILAHMISLALASSCAQQAFPESLLVQLLKVMLHPNVEARVAAHQIFSILLVPNSNRPRHDVASMQSGILYQSRKWNSSTSSAFASITARLEKLRREKDGSKAEKQWKSIKDDIEEKEIVEEECKQGHGCKNSLNCYNISSIIDLMAGSVVFTEESLILKLGEDQIAHLLSAFWIQARLPDNLPSNIEAIFHSFALTLISSRWKNQSDNLVVQFFQLALSLRNICLDLNNGMLPSACQRSMLILSVGMLMFAAKFYHIPDLIDVLKTVIRNNVDPNLGISDDLQVYVKPDADVREYGSSKDSQLATSLIFELRNKLYESENVMVDILVGNIAKITKLEAEDVAKQLSELFTPDDVFMFGPRSVLEFDHNQAVSCSKESLSIDGDFQTNSLVEDDATSEASVKDLVRFIPRIPSSSYAPVSHIIGIGQLLESALEVADEVVGTSISTSPLPYTAMANQCEALGSCTRKKLSNWLEHENHSSKPGEEFIPSYALDRHASTLYEITSDDGSAKGAAFSQDPWLSMRLPPASPFDNFLKAAGQ